MSDSATYRRPHTSLNRAHTQKTWHIIPSPNSPVSRNQSKSSSVPQTRRQSCKHFQPRENTNAQVAPKTTPKQNQEKTQSGIDSQQVFPSSKLTESLSSSLSVCILCLPASTGRCSSINFMLSDRPPLHSTWLTDPRLCQWKI